jgi:SUMO ligase MMS21 Smc5/6 complex component
LSEQKFDLILSELQKINERVTKIDEHVIKIDERVTKIDERVTKMDERVIKIETEQNRHGEHIQQLIQIVGTTNLNFEEFQQDTTKRFDRVDRSLRLVESDLDLLLQKSNEHERDINRLKHVE